MRMPVVVCPRRSDGACPWWCAPLLQVWEVTAQLVGFAASVAALQALSLLGASSSWEVLVGSWALVQGSHVIMRYAALSQLQFSNLNLKRVGGRWRIVG